MYVYIYIYRMVGCGQRLGTKLLPLGVAPPVQSTAQCVIWRTSRSTSATVASLTRSRLAAGRFDRSPALKLLATPASA